MLLGAVSTVIQVVLVPWAIVMAVHRRRRSDVIVLVSLLVGLGIQGLARAWRAIRSSRTAPGTWPTSSSCSACGSSGRWSPASGGSPSLSTTAAVNVGVGSATVVVVIAILARPGRLDRDRRIFVVCAVLTAIGSYLVTVWYRGTSAVDLSVRGDQVMSGGRYGYLAVLLLFDALVIMVDTSGRRWLEVLLLAQAAFVIATSLTLANPRSTGPSWTASVRRRGRMPRRSEPRGRQPAHLTRTGVVDAGRLPAPPRRLRLTGPAGWFRLASAGVDHLVGCRA